MPSTYQFNGDSITYLGMFGIIITYVFLMFLWKYYWNTNPENKNRR